jgi:hypothetical protein
MTRTSIRTGEGAGEGHRRRICAAAVFGWAALGPGCGEATRPSTASLSATTVAPLTATLTADSSVCLPGRFVATLPDPAGACPRPVPARSWRVQKHRSALVTPSASRDEAPPPALLTSARCAYTWTGDGTAPAGGPPLPASLAVRPLCLEERRPPAALMAGACPASVQIGVRPDDGVGCPPATGWHAEPLFPGKEGELGRYCRYRATTTVVSDNGPVEVISDDAPTDALPPWVRPDCAAVAPLAIPADRAAMEGAYADAVEMVSALPLLTGGVASRRVRVAVIDSALDKKNNGLPGVGRASHGRAMGMLVARMACPDRSSLSSCAADVRTHPALWLERGPNGYRRDPRGGFFGFQGDLATAIIDAVDAVPPEEPLVINISLGWSRFLGGDEASPAAFPPAVRAVYTAIEYARCRGALVIAAAGNASGTPLLPTGPLVPGAWETRPTPTGARCQGQLGVGQPHPGPIGAPLLRAAGGLDGRDRVLFNTPVLGRPRLAAPASSAIVPDRAPEAAQTAGGYTGSSVAATVASAAAAIAWAYPPHRTADEVADFIYEHGVDLRQPANFCRGGGACDSIHRLSICRTMQAACLAAPAGCVSPPLCPSDGARSTPADNPDFAVAPVDPCAPPNPNPACLPPTAIPGPPAIDNAWPLPFVGRQPPDPICTVCGLELPLTWLTFNTNPAGPDAPSYYYQAAKMTLFDSAGALTLFIDAAFDPTLYLLQGMGGSLSSGGIDLSLLSGAASFGTVNFRAWDKNEWALTYSSPVYQTDNLFVQP